jgi:hypothetical protein
MAIDTAPSSLIQTVNGKCFIMHSETALMSLSNTICPCGINRLDCDYHKPDQPTPRKTCDCYLYLNQVCDICQGPTDEDTGKWYRTDPHITKLLTQLIKTNEAIHAADAAQPQLIIYHPPCPGDTLLSPDRWVTQVDHNTLTYTTEPYPLVLMSAPISPLWVENRN